MPRRAVVAMVFVLVLAPLAAGGATAAPPSTPAAYYGGVVVNGEPAPAGLTVEAVVDGEVSGALTTGEGGSLGGAGAFDEKLLVEGSEGENVTFRIGTKAVRTVAWESGAHEQLTLSVQDTAAPTADASAPGRIPAGTTVRLDATGSTDDVGVVSYEWTLPDGTHVTGATPEVAFTQPGQKTVELAVTDAAGNTETTTVSLAVTGDSGGNPNPGGPPDDSDDETPDDSDDETPDDDDALPEGVPDVVVDADSVNVTFTGAAANEPATVEFPDTAATNSSGVALQSLTLTTTRQTNVSLDVSVSRDLPAGAESPGENTVMYLNVSESVSEDALGEVSFGFTVSASRLGDTDPADVSLWRYHAGEWAQLETTVVGQSGDTYQFRAVSPGLSVFSVRTASADVAVADASLGQSSVTVGERVELSVTVTNDGTANGTVTVPFVVGSKTIAERTVAVPAGGQRTLTVAYTPENTGSYDVQVGNVSAGTLDVAPQQTDGPTDQQDDPPSTQAPDGPQDQRDDPATTPREQGGFSPTTVGALGLIVAAVLGLFLLARRRA